LMDLEKPVVDGWEATRRLKGNPQTRDIPIIALSAHALAGEREKALAAGCNEFDTKPIEFDRLVATLPRLLANRKCRSPVVHRRNRTPRRGVLFGTDVSLNRGLLGYRGPPVTPRCSGIHLNTSVVSRELEDAGVCALCVSEGRYERSTKYLSSF